MFVVNTFINCLVTSPLRAHHYERNRVEFDSYTNLFWSLRSEFACHSHFGLASVVKWEIV